MMTAASWQGMTNNGEGGSWFSSAVQTVPKAVVSRSMPELFVPTVSVKTASVSFTHHVFLQVLGSTTADI